MLKVAVKIKGFLRGARSSHFDNRNNSSPIVRHFSQQPIGYGSFVINFIMFQNDLSYVPETYKTIGKNNFEKLTFFFLSKQRGLLYKYCDLTQNSTLFELLVSSVNLTKKICENAGVLQINIAN